MSGHAWAEWGAEPAVWLGLGLLALGYGRGLFVLWRRAGLGHGVSVRQAAAFGGGLLALVLALASPIDHLADELLSAHMVQHLLLIMVAAPLLALGEPVVAFAWSIPRRPRLAIASAATGVSGVRYAWRLLSSAAVAWGLHVGALYVWHLPALYQAALASEVVHVLEHVFFLGTGLLFWYALFGLARHRRADHGAAVLYLFGAAMAETPLGALMLFSQQLWYPVYAATTGAYGLSALEDQQLAGTIMWVPPGLLMLGIATAMFLAWLEALERRMKEREDATV